jgi:hypothetical protein
MPVHASLQPCNRLAPSEVESDAGAEIEWVPAAHAANERRIAVSAGSSTTSDSSSC